MISILGIHRAREVGANPALEPTAVPAYRSLTFIACATVYALALLSSPLQAEAQTLDSGFRFLDPEQQALFVEAVRKGGLPFSVRDDGTFLYSSRDEERVTAIRARTLNAAFVPSAHFPDIEVEKRVTAALDSAKISFGINVRQGRRYVTWAERDTPRVESVIRAVLQSR